MVSIRGAVEEDASAIAHVHVQSWLTTYAGIVPESYLASLDEADRALNWKQWLTQDVQVYVAEMDGEVVGFAAGGRIREPLQSYEAELFAIYLLRHAQGQGVGRSLLKRLANSMRTQAFNSMAVWVLETNSSSKFYEKNGALPIASKEMEIGGAVLPIVAYGWPDLKIISQ